MGCSTCKNWKSVGHFGECTISWGDKAGTASPLVARAVKKNGRYSKRTAVLLTRHDFCCNQWRGSDEE